MRYLHIHTFILWLLVLTYTIVDGTLWLVGYILYLLWTFKPVSISKAWKECHKDDDEFSPRRIMIYEDKNIFESFKRRWLEVKEVVLK